MKAHPKIRPAEIRLAANIRTLAAASPDPIVKDVERSISEFCLYKVVGDSYSWKYLSDERSLVCYTNSINLVKSLPRTGP